MTTDLHSLHVLVTRPAPQGRVLCELIDAQGGKSIYFPTIAFAKPQDETAFLSAIESLAEQQWILFISPQAVTSAWPAISKIPGALSFSYAAVGAGTQKALAACGVKNIVAPQEKYGSESLLALPEFQDIKQQKIAIIKGEGGREWLADTLRARSAIVTEIIAYRRVLPEVAMLPRLTPAIEGERRSPLPGAIPDEWRSHVSDATKSERCTPIPDAIVCTSYEAVQNLKILYGKNHWDKLKNIPLVVLSERIKMLAKRLGFQTIWVTFEASNAAIIATLSRIMR